MTRVHIAAVLAHAKSQNHNTMTPTSAKKSIAPIAVDQGGLEFEQWESAAERRSTIPTCLAQWP
jgi:hypothetical protein